MARMPRGISKLFGVALFVAASFVPSSARSQDTIQWPPHRAPGYTGYSEWGLIVGYAHAYDKPASSRYHALEIGLARGSVAPHAFASAAAYWSNELLFKGERLVWGPKLGCHLGILGVFFLGAETIYYTDMRTGSWRGALFFGIGSYPINLGIRPQFKIAGDGGLLENDLQIALTCRIAHWGRK